MNIGKSYSDTININDTTTSILQAKIDILSAIVEGQNDIIQGRTLSLEKSFDSIDKLLEKMNFPQGSCLYKTDASKKRGGRAWMKRIS